MNTLARQSEVYNSQDTYNNKQESTCRRCITELQVLHRITVDVVYQYVGGVSGAAAGQDSNTLEYLEGTDGDGYQKEENLGGKHRHGDPQKLLNLASVIQCSRLVDLGGDRL